MAQRDPIASLTALARAVPLMVNRAMTITMDQAAAQGQRTTAFQNRTGRLRASIRAGVIEINLHRIVGALTAGAKDAQPGKGGDWATPSWDYAPWVELGTNRTHPRSYIWSTMLYVAAQGILGRAMQQEWRRWRP